jgi:hypothetical protein
MGGDGLALELTIFRWLHESMHGCPGLASYVSRNGTIDHNKHCA